MMLLDDILRHAIAGGASPADCDAFRSEVVALNLARAHRPDTVQRAARVAHLEKLMRGMDTDKRVGAICSRLGISRASYYRLRSLSLNLDETTAR
ncbi:MAG TPA: hypothetical protein VGN07_23790 [Steroidobacteraceae bacterium]|jgi:hypothetical protein